MAKPEIKANPRVRQIFEDLEKYLDFCREYGYKFDEAELYDMRSHTYRQFGKLASGKQPKNNWVEDAKAFNEQ